MMILITALAPVFIICFYIYFRDKYEKEPIKLLILSLLVGALTVIPILFVERFFMFFEPPMGLIGRALYEGFLVAGFTEEAFKLLALYLLVWKNPNFNEKFDGIVYAVFVSLGFAAVENVIYVAQGGINVAITRAITAVPVHAILGIRMGYFFGIAHMYREFRRSYLIKAFMVPFLLHGLYDFVLMAKEEWLLLAFIPYMTYLYFMGFKKMKETSDASIFRDDVETE